MLSQCCGAPVIIDLSKVDLTKVGMYQVMFCSKCGNKCQVREACNHEHDERIPVMDSLPQQFSCKHCGEIFTKETDGG